MYQWISDKIWLIIRYIGLWIKMGVKMEVDKMAHGLIDIYIEKSTNKISILVYHVTEIGFSKSIGELVDGVEYETLKQSVEKYIELSLAKYKCSSITYINPFKKTKYKSWNKFFDAHYLIEVIYWNEKNVYEIDIPTREKKTKSFGSVVDGFSFKLTKDEYNEKFDDIIRYILDNIRSKQE